MKEDRILVVTKNSKQYPYSHMFELPPLVEGKPVSLIERAVFEVRVSEVTDATSTPSYLVLRTYAGLLFYQWDTLCEQTTRNSSTTQPLELLKQGHGIQEAVTFDQTTNTFYFVGEGNADLFYLKCENANPSGELRMQTGGACTEKFGGAADASKQDMCDPTMLTPIF